MYLSNRDICITTRICLRHGVLYISVADNPVRVLGNILLTTLPRHSVSVGPFRFQESERLARVMRLLEERRNEGNCHVIYLMYSSERRDKSSFWNY